MQKFTTLKGIVAPLDQANIDTDQIIPKQYLKSIKRTGFGPSLFDDWRYLDPGEPGVDHSKRRLNSDFILNKACYQGAKILLTRENFGCGSSREHAPWAILDYGISCIIAPSYADIFINNCFKNGILPVVLNHQQIDELFSIVLINEGCEFEIDLPAQTITSQLKNAQSNQSYHFDIDPSQKHRLLEGLDDIGITLQHADKIKAYELRQKKLTPWVFN